MKTTIKINMMYVLKAMEAVSDSLALRMSVVFKHTDTWIIESDDQEEHEEILDLLRDQFESFGIPKEEYEII